MRPFIIGGLTAWMVFMVFVGVVHAETAWHNFTDTQIVEAIGKAENSKRFPYGIKSIACSGQECRKICLNSVRNGRARWAKAGFPDDLIVFIGKRYSPPTTNPNWVRLVKWFLVHGS